MISWILVVFSLLTLTACGSSSEDGSLDSPAPGTADCGTNLPDLDPDPLDTLPGYSGSLYEGPLYETSLQLGDGNAEGVELETIVSGMNRNNVVRALAMFGIDAEDELDMEEGGDEGIGHLRAAIELAPCRFVPYFVRGNGELNSLDTDNLRMVLTTVESQFGTQVLRGIGELEFYKESWGLLDTDDLSLTAVYDLASESGIQVFGHWAGGPDSLGPGTGARSTSIRDSLARALERYPGITFLFHLFPTDLEPEIFDLMDTYSNFYFSVDTDHILQRIPWQCGLLDCFEGSEDGTADFVTYFDANVQALLDQAVERYRPLIEDHPNRFMWGTENVGNYSFDPEVYDRTILFIRAFIAQLEESSREAFAYQNAERVFGVGPSLEL